MTAARNNRLRISRTHRRTQWCHGPSVGNPELDVCECSVVTYTHRHQCACIGNGCMSALVLESPQPGWDEHSERALTLNGWRLDHGRWICGNHGDAA